MIIKGYTSDVMHNKSEETQVDRNVFECYGYRKHKVT